MAGSLLLYPNFDGPYAVYATTTATGGSWAASTAYAFIIIAWDDPLEQDWNLARFLCNVPDPAGGVTIGGAFGATATITTGAGNDDIVNLNWQAPRRLPHHYTVYYQAASSFSYSTLATKIQPSSGTTQNGEIPGWATSAVFANSTAVSETRSVAIRATSANAYYDLDGNIAISLYSGQTYVPRPAGGVPTFNDDPNVLFAANGERTRAYETSTAVGQSFIEYAHGPIMLQGIGHSSPWVQLTLVTGLETQFREKQAAAFDGRPLELSYINGSDIIALAAEFTHGGIGFYSTGAALATSTRAEALAFLDKCRRLAIPLALEYLPTSTEVYSGQRFYVTIEEINERGYTQIQANDRIRITFKVWRTDNYRTAPAPLVVTAVSTGSKYFQVAGDKRYLFPAGTRIEIIRSTGNDGLYGVASTALSGGNTRITVTNPFGDSTADGYIRIWDTP